VGENVATCTENERGMNHLLQYIRLISFLLLGVLLSRNHLMLITHTGGHEKTHSINPGICRLKLWLLYYECAKLILEASNHASPDHRKRQCLYHRHPDICTRAMQETKEALTVIKYPWGLHTVHGQCFTCGMWCSIVKWLHCSMVLRKSITRIWINLAASLEYLSEIVCQTKECQQNYSSP